MEQFARRAEAPAAMPRFDGWSETRTVAAKHPQIETTHAIMVHRKHGKTTLPNKYHQHHCAAEQAADCAPAAKDLDAFEKSGLQNLLPLGTAGLDLPSLSFARHIMEKQATKIKDLEV